MNEEQIEQLNTAENIAEGIVEIADTDMILTNINIDEEENIPKDNNDSDKAANADNVERQTIDNSDIESVIKSILESRLAETIKPLLQELESTKKELSDVKAKKDPTQEQIVKMVEQYTKEESAKKEQQRILEETQKFYNENKNMIYEAEEFIKVNGFTEEYKQKIAKVTILELIGNMDLQAEQKNLFVKNLQKSSLLNNTYKILTTKQNIPSENSTNNKKEEINKKAINFKF